MTLVEVMVASAVITVLALALVSVQMYSGRTLAVLSNCMDLDNQNRLALDRMSREMRQADALVSYTTNQVTFSTGSNQVSFTYYPQTREVRRASGVASQVLLHNCNYLRYDIFRRTPTNGAYDYYPAATPAECKVVRITWACSMQTGPVKTNLTTAQSARIVIRKQH